MTGRKTHDQQVHILEHRPDVPDRRLIERTRTERTAPFRTVQHDQPPPDMPPDDAGAKRKPSGRKR